MKPWTNFSLETMTASAMCLASFTYELQLKLKERGSDLEPDDALLLLRQITSLAESMRHAADVAKVRTHLRSKDAL